MRGFFYATITDTKAHYFWPLLPSTFANVIKITKQQGKGRACTPQPRASLINS